MTLWDLFILDLEHFWPIEQEAHVIFKICEHQSYFYAFFAKKKQTDFQRIVTRETMKFYSFSAKRLQSTNESTSESSGNLNAAFERQGSAWQKQNTLRYWFQMQSFEIQEEERSKCTNQLSSPILQRFDGEKSMASCSWTSFLGSLAILFYGTPEISKIYFWNKKSENCGGIVNAHNVSR